MNVRQKNKNLKKQIKKLKSDNDLMKSIIEDSPSMLELYDRYNQPLNINVSTIQVQECHSKRFLMPLDFYNNDRLEMIKEEITSDLLNEIKNYINFEVNTEYMQPTITASIFVGGK